MNSSRGIASQTIAFLVYLMYNILEFTKNVEVHFKKQRATRTEIILD